MRTAYVDAFSGISGDMTVGALLDCGVDPNSLTDALGALGTGATFRVEKTKRRGITASKFHVEATDTKKHRHLHHITEMIEKSDLPQRVKANSIAVFRKLGEAEASVHGTTIEKVHFHEVGAVDSICDIVGACYGFDALGIERVCASPVNVGSGTVNSEHGVLPVPAPATAALLRGMPVYSRGPQLELTTPTGAALLAGLGADFSPMPALRISAIGYGAGDRDFPEHANVLRVMVGNDSGAAETTIVAIIEANIDDSTPEVLGYALERLLDAGALDATLEPLIMKKNRPGNLLRVMTTIEDRERIAALVFAETSTLGLRMYTAERRVEKRDFVTVNTPYGDVRIKVAGTSFAPEYEDCRKLAVERGAPLKQVLNEAAYAYLKTIR